MQFSRPCITCCPHRFQAAAKERLAHLEEQAAAAVANCLSSMGLPPNLYRHHTRGTNAEPAHLQQDQLQLHQSSALRPSWLREAPPSSSNQHSQERAAHATTSCPGAAQSRSPRPLAPPLTHSMGAVARPRDAAGDPLALSGSVAHPTPSSPYEAVPQSNIAIVAPPGSLTPVPGLDTGTHLSVQMGGKSLSVTNEAVCMQYDQQHWQQQQGQGQAEGMEEAGSGDGCIQAAHDEARVSGCGFYVQSRPPTPPASQPRPSSQQMDF